MHSYPPTPPPDAPPVQNAAQRPRARISWAAVAGFGALGLLWPLLRLVGFEAGVGTPVTAFVAFVGAFAVWVLGAGFGDVPRPVATLTLSGVLFGILLAIASMLLDDWPARALGLALVGAVIEIARAAGFGALAGLAASAIQRARRGNFS